jgi:hypothetical protein
MEPARDALNRALQGVQDAIEALPKFYVKELGVPGLLAGIG